MVPADVREEAKIDQAHRLGLSPAETAKDTQMTYFEAILKVLVVGLILGAGLPALFAHRSGRVLEGHRRRWRREPTRSSHTQSRIEGLGLLLFAVVDGRDRDRRPLDHPGARSSITSVSILSP